MADDPGAGDRLFRSILAARPKLVTGVPDGMLSATIFACQSTDQFPYIACAREEECIGVACGAAMAGERAVVLMQNAGLLNSLGAYATMGLRYGLPFVVVVTNRGALADPNGYDIEKREAFDAGVRPMARVFDFDAGDLPDDLMPAAFKWAEAARKPVILALEKRLGGEAAP
jgi:sulfopyruvate decarboxylase TPP-binding subunit